MCKREEAASHGVEVGFSQVNNLIYIMLLAQQSIATCFSHGR